MFYTEKNRSRAASNSSGGDGAGWRLLKVKLKNSGVASGKW